MTRLAKFKRVCRKYLILNKNEDEYIDVIFGTVFANRLDTKPIWTYIVGPPGSGKTEILQALIGSEEIIACTTLTKHSLMSGWREPAAKKQKKEDKEDPSLLHQLDGKTLIIKDFTTMLQMRWEQLHDILGQLRSAYDGVSEKKYGNRKKITVYRAKFGILAAVTHAIEEHKQLLSSLGERFLTYNMPEVSAIDKTRRTLKAMSNLDTEAQEADMRKAARYVLELEPDTSKITEAQQRRISKIVQVVALARTEIKRDYKTKEPEFPHPEHPTRLGKQLSNLAMGIAMAREKEAVTDSEICLVQHIALHSISTKRRKLFDVLLKEYPDWLSVNDIVEIMNFKSQAVYYWFQDLLLLNLVEKRTIVGPKNDIQQYRIIDSVMLRRIMEIK